MLRTTPMALALGMVWGLNPMATLALEAASSADEVMPLKEVTVTSTRTERRVDDVPNTVTVIPHQQMEREGARDIKDLFKNEIDVSVRAAPTRFSAAGQATGRAGVEGINIRGLEGNQVLMIVDGIRVPHGFSFSSFSTGRGDYIAMEGLKSAEVLRGPASTQFGGDGLAGAVSFRTLDPSDVLSDRQSLGGFVRATHAGIDRSWTSSFAVAARNDRWQGMLLGRHAQGHEVGNRGSNDVRNVDRTTPNPVDHQNRYLLGKAFLAMDAAHQLGLSLETLKRQQDTEVYSARAKPPLTATSTLDLDTHDQTARDRLSIEHRFSNTEAPWVQRAESRLYWQNAKVRQLSIEDRNTAPDRTRDNAYTSTVWGMSSLVEGHLAGWADQRVTLGFDWSQSEISATRNGTVPPAGEAFPTKPFPDTRYTLTGAFAQSEIEAGSLSVIPGLRFDHYKLDPSAAGYTGGATASLSDHAVTPRLGFLWRLDPAFSPYAQWTKGFRPPTPDQVNNGFTNVAVGYASIGNPNLKAERANSIELGLRGKLRGWRYSLAAFDNRYDDFIQQQVVSRTVRPAHFTVFQYVNLAQAHIRGLEARTEWAFASKWTANLGLALAKGDSEVRGTTQPLDSVNPLKAVLGVRYDDSQWGARATIVHSKGKEADRIATASTPQFAPPSYTTLDLGFHWRPQRKLSVNANLNNVFDTKYWRWSDVRGLADNSTVRDAYTAPGRNVQVSLRYDF